MPPSPRPVHERLVVRLLIAIALGLLTASSYQLTNWWFLAPVGVAGFCLLVREQSLPRAGLYGFAFAWPMWWSAITWLSVLDPAAPVALSFVQSLWFIALGMVVAGIQPGRRVGLPLWPLWAACAWMAAEFAFSRWPWGAFGWLRLGYTSVDAPWGGLLPFVGVAGAGFAIALLGSCLAWAVTRPPRRHLVPVAIGAVVLSVVAGVARGWVPEEQPAATVNVGIVQGNVFGVGINAMGRARSMPNNHLDETVRLMADVHTRAMPPPDLVVWPESSTDSDPRTDRRTRDILDTAAQLTGVPMLVGTIMLEPRTTSVLWWDPDEGMMDRYDKQNLVPFGEWIPMREFFLPLLPVLEQVGDQAVPGTEPGLLTGRLADGRELRVGDLICYELAYDDTVAAMFQTDPRVIVVQSNNAPYGWSAQNAQQFAITRARAMEGRREFAVVTTSGISGLIGQRGEVLDRTAEFTNAHRVYTMPERTTRTPAMTLALPLSMLIAALGAMAGPAAVTRGLVCRHRPSTVDGHDHTVEEHSDRAE